VNGGDNNYGSGTCSAVSGGDKNAATGTWSTVIGGNETIVSEEYGIEEYTP